MECVFVKPKYHMHCSSNNALLLSGIQFRLPTACNVERTQEPTPGTNVLFVCC